METNNLEVDKTEKIAAKVQGSDTSVGFEKSEKICADKLHSMAEGLGKNRADQHREPGMAKCGKHASVWLGHSAEYIRKFDYKQADAKAREYVGQNTLRQSIYKKEDKEWMKNGAAPKRYSRI